MEQIATSIEKMNLPHGAKMRMKNFIESQHMMKSQQSKGSLENLELNISEYRCAKCRDMTFIIEDGVAIPCKCREIRQAEEILKKSGISEEFRNKRFSNFVYSSQRQIIDAYKEACTYSKYFKDIENDRYNSIMFMGQVGSGKTHLSLAIANELMENSVGVVYMSYREVITKLKQNIMDDVYYHRVLGKYKVARILLIDDLFKGKVTDSDINIIFELINYRYFNKLPVIVSCELDVDGLLNVDEAIGSRLVEMCKGYLLELKGQRLNYRMYGK